MAAVATKGEIKNRAAALACAYSSHGRVVHSELYPLKNLAVFDAFGAQKRDFFVLANSTVK